MFNSLKRFDYEDLFLRYRYPVLFLLLGLIFVGFGIFYAKTGGGFGNSTTVEVLESTTSAQNGQIIVEVAGAVENPGVYNLSSDKRVEDALIAAGGISQQADRDWMEKTLNRANKLVDGQKIYIPREGETKGASIQVTNLDSGVSSGKININNASISELDSLWGIGPVTGQNIIEQRPYSNVDELLTRGILKKNVYEKIKDKLSVY